MVWDIAVSCELGAIYDALSQNQPSPLPDLPIQYADFSLWQRSWLQGEAMQKQLDYWLAQFAGEITSFWHYQQTMLARFCSNITGRRTPLRWTRQSTNSYSRSVAVKVARFLRCYWRATRCFLHRYTGQEEVIIGTPITNRNRAELEALIGCFNSLALRFTFANQPTFSQLSSACAESVATSAYAHQEMPFEVLLEHLPVARDTSRHPIPNHVYTGRRLC